MIKLFQYMADHASQIGNLTMEHIEMTAIAVGIAILIGVPLGILISYVRRLGTPVIGTANVVQAIPSMALLGLGIPLLGIGVLPAVVMVIIYSLLPIIKNTYTGISGIDPEMVEAAKGIGLTRRQVLSHVKIPMALPIIMAGVRISSVTAVGLMTMAAFIGAGGLGYLVFSGIRTVNNYQILAGAIPACILALVVDFLMSLIEKLVTPISLQKQFGTSKAALKKKRTGQKVVLGVAAVLICVLIAVSIFGSMSHMQKEITVGSKDFTEQLILCNLYSDFIEAHTNIHCIRKENLGGSQVCYEALKKGEIDLYVDYTGTLYSNVLKHSQVKDMQTVYNTCEKDLKKQNVSLLDQCAFNNTYTLAVGKDTANKYNLSAIRDIANSASKLRLGCTLEFQNRHDCMEALQKKYNGMKFKRVVGIDGSPRFTALKNKEVEVIDAFSTDGLLKKYNLQIMQDKDQIFPPYYAVPCVYSDTLKEHPELKEVLNTLAPKLTNEVMMELNYQVDVKNREPSDVAKEYLKKNKLI